MPRELRPICDILHLRIKMKKQRKAIRPIITEDMKSIVSTQRLCFAATVTPDGKPNLSPKGTIRVLDNWRLFFCDIASPATRHNLDMNPWIELNIVDPLSRRGYRFFGKATIHVGDEVFRKATEVDGERYPVSSVIVLLVERALPVISPGYDYVHDEWEMRSQWKRKRGQLEEHFEQHIKTVGPQKGKE